VNLRGFDPSATPLTPEEAIRGFLDALGVPPQRIPAGLQAQVALYRSLLAERCMLVLLDNASDEQQVRPLLPVSPTCLGLVTSRGQLTGLIATEGAHSLTLDLLCEAEAHELLVQRLGAEAVAAEPRAALELITLCARLPLALSIAAARAATQPGLTLGTLAAELRAARRRLDPFSAGEASTNLRTVFSWSYRNLDGSPARLFRLLGLHRGPDVSTPAAASLAGVPCDLAAEVLAELTQAQLLSEHAPDRFAFHDLLRAYAGELVHRQESDDQRHAATHRMLDHYLHTAAASDRLIQTTRGEHQGAVEYCQRALDLHRAVGNRHGEALTWDSLGYAHHQLGHHAQAVACFRRALTAYRQLGGDRYRQTVVLTHLGDAFHAAGDLPAACDAWRSALVILQDLDHLDADEVRARLAASGVPPPLPLASRSNHGPVS